MGMSKIYKGPYRPVLEILYAAAAKKAANKIDKMPFKSKEKSGMTKIREPIVNPRIAQYSSFGYV